MRVALNNVMENDNFKIVENVVFDINKTEEYKELFKEFKLNNVIIDGEFESIKWKIMTHVDNFTLDFSFNEVAFMKRFGDKKLFMNFVTATKVFYLYQMLSKDSTTVYNSLRRLKIICNDTDYFDKAKIKIYVDFFKIDANRRILVDLKSLIFDFYPLPSIDNEYYEASKELSMIKDNKAERRKLASFESMFKLDEIITTFYEHSSDELKEIFFPIILWWNITSIIPLRTIEFLLTPYKCVRKETINGIEKYYIKLRRCISKGGIKDNDISRHTLEKSFKKKEYETTERIYNLVMEYKNIVDKYDDIEDFCYEGQEIGKRPFLLSFKSYYKYRTTIGKSNFLQNLTNVQWLNRDSFYTLFDEFYEDIVGRSFNKIVVSKYEKADTENLIHYVQPMDTRHFSIMNMVLSGVEPTIIKEIAGHKNIRTTFSYSNHIENYAKDFILAISKKKIKSNVALCLDSDLSNSDTGEYKSQSQLRYLRARLNDKEYASKFKKVADGYCLYEGTDITPCILCGGEHRKCSHYVPMDGIGLNLVTSLQKETSKEMTTEIQTLKWIINNHNKIEDWAIKYNTSLSKIKSYMNKEIDYRSNFGDLNKF